MISKKKYVIAIVSHLIIIFGCVSSIDEGNLQKSNFNFNDTVKIVTKPEDETGISNDELRIAIAAISSPRETFGYYEELFGYIESRIGIKVTMIQRKTYEEVNQLLKMNQIDLAFICSGGYVYGTTDSSFNLFAMPEKDGKSIYQAYIITHTSSGIERIEDLRGKRFAFTDPLSTTGKLYPHKKLKEFGVLPCDFFSHTIYTYAHDNSIQLVAKQMVDGASINSLVYDHLTINSPERVKNLKIIDKSEWYAMPPLVISNAVAPELKSKLMDVFLNMHKDEKGKNILNKLLVDKYIASNDTIFDTVRKLVDLIEE